MNTIVGKLKKALPLLPIVVVALVGSAWMSINSLAPGDMNGAWKLVKKDGQKVKMTMVKIVSDDHYVYSQFDESSKKFDGTMGGVYEMKAGKWVETTEFNTWDAENVGKEFTFEVSIKGKKMTLKGTDGTSEEWKRIDNGSEQSLAGAWRIRERKVDEEMRTMKRGPRKTIKMLSGTRFQWTAFNTETKKFSGCGGGTYTAKDGKYTETIEYFSRDSSRVGMSLSFDYDLKGKDWHHSGFSSKGKPIYEVWALEFK